MILQRILLPAALIGLVGAAQGRQAPANVFSEYRDYQDRAVLDDRTTTFDLPGRVEVELHSGMLDRRPDGPLPAFGQLDRNGDGVIDEDEASAYRLLGDDFIHADDNRDTVVSQREYAHWTSRN